MRQFSVPYNGEKIDVYLAKIERYLPYVHDIYLGTPIARDFFSGAIEIRDPEYYTKCHNFLLAVRNTGLKTVIVLNGRYDDIEHKNQQRFLADLYNYIREMNIFGVVCSDFIIAEELHSEFPDLEINTSCNCPHYEIHHLNAWRDHAGVSLVNPPRDASRNITYLKKLKESGYRIKLLINESCYVNCPFISSFCGVSQELRPCIRTHPKLSQEALNPFKTCVIFPSWLDEYDKIVDIYKITGRYAQTDYVFGVLDVFSSGRECTLQDLVDGVPEDINLDIKDVPLRMTDCDKNCSQCCFCDKLFEERIQQ